MERLTKEEKSLEGFLVYTASIDVKTLSDTILGLQETIRNSLRDNRGDIEFLIEKAEQFRWWIEDAIYLNILLLGKVMLGDAVGAYTDNEAEELKTKVIELLGTMGDTWVLIKNLSNKESSVIDEMLENIEKGSFDLLCTFLSFYMDELKQIIVKYNL